MEMPEAYFAAEASRVPWSAGANISPASVRLVSSETDDKTTSALTSSAADVGQRRPQWLLRRAIQSVLRSSVWSVAARPRHSDSNGTHVTKRAPTDPGPEPTHYANVDLDVYAGAPLDGFVQALGDEVLVLYVGGGRRKYEAHVELVSSHMARSADDAIVGLVSLIRGLPRVHRKIWDSAKRREFNIGIEAGLEPHGFELRLEQRTLQAIANVRGVLVITVYAPDLRDTRLSMTRRRKKR
jgi:hypothetical protein